MIDASMYESSAKKVEHSPQKGEVCCVIESVVEIIVNRSSVLIELAAAALAATSMHNAAEREEAEAQVGRSLPDWLPPRPRRMVYRRTLSESESNKNQFVFPAVLPAGVERKKKNSNK